ncbi:MAG: response regulator transcription factor [Dehalococcoidales bacterium]|nr:response regulator transcription factor [Dehalococcoidales bacterium]
MAEIRVLIVDDHSLFRRGISDVLKQCDDIRVLAEAATGLEAIDKTRELRPDVVLMDLHMPECTGLEAIQAIHTEMPHVNVLVLTVSEMEHDLFAAVKYGAKGYLLKNAEPDELVQAIYYVAKGESIISPLMATKLLTEFQGLTSGVEKGPETETHAELSPRENEVLQLVARGATNREIGTALFISENTVKTHLQNIMDKLHLANRSQAAAYAIQKGLVSPGN